MSEWIKISDKKPCAGECVIATVKNHINNRLELRYPVYYLQKTYDDGYAFYCGDTNNVMLPDISEIIAWMPLPAPYDGEDRSYEFR